MESQSGELSVAPHLEIQPLMPTWVHLKSWFILISAVDFTQDVHMLISCCTLFLKMFELYSRVMFHRCHVTPSRGAFETILEVLYKLC